MPKVSHSLEGLVGGLCAIGTAILAALLYWLLSAHQVGLQTTFLVLVGTVVAGFALWSYVSRRIVKPIRSLTSQVEAIRVEDYNLQADSYFSRGSTAALHRELNELGADLQRHKERYDRHVHIIYRLIENMSTPVLIFNQMQRLIHANSAFSMIYARPWASARNWQAQRLGLTRATDGWQFEDKANRSRWQINSSELQDRTSVYQMLIITDIQHSLRQTQQQSWQEVVRVLSHEIRNSLSPIISLAQLLEGMADLPPNAHKASSVIIERGRYLQEFVNSYSQINKTPEIRKQWIAARQLADHLRQLFTETTLEVSGSNLSLFADRALLEQVLINLVKNAIEASPEGSVIKLHFRQTVYEHEIDVLDEGHGIMNTENLFVPFYSTKENGQGIGLALSRQIVEEHGGQLTLTDRQDGPGVKATIRIPRGEASSSALR